jgi:streptogramin lyase
VRKLTTVLAATAALLATTASTAHATPRIEMRWTGGLGGGLSANAAPHTIARGPGDVMWFTESANPGGVARATNGVNEFRAGLTPGFTANGFPHRIGLGPDGNMWFTEGTNPGRLARITNAGQVTEFTGGVTPGFSANRSPAEVVAGPDGNLWMTETGNPGAVARVTPAGVFTELTGGVTPGFTANAFPAGIDVGPDGRIWFAEATAGFGRIDPATLQVSELVPGVTPGLTPGLGPQDITAGPDGAMWATAAGGPGRIVRIAPGDRVTEFTGGVTPGLSVGGSPTGIAAGPDGNLWFVKTADPGMIVRITPDGEVTEFRGGLAPGLPANGFPIAIAPGYDGAMWFTMFAAPGRIGHITVGPGVVTGAASAIRDTSARVAGSVRPNGQETTYRFEYGRTTAYGSRTPSLGADDGLAARTVAQTITNLRPSTQYHYRLIAINGSDTTRGEDRTFTTGAPGQAGRQEETGGGSAAPRLSHLRLSPTRFRAASHGGSIGALRQRRGRSRGTVVSFRLDRATRVRFGVRRCLNRRCTRSRAAGGFTRTSKTGTSRFRFTGRIAGKRLAAGRYRLVATPQGGTARRAGFRIRR